MVHKDWTQSANGFVHVVGSTSEVTLGISTLASHSGTVVHTGQIFFPETWNDQVFRTPPYDSNKQNRTFNTQDTVLPQAFQNGYNAYTRCV